MNLLNEQLHADWIKAIRDSTENRVELLRIGIVGGGSINDARRVETNVGTYFVKLNDATAYPKMFEQEAIGLRFLIKHSKFNVPKPIATGETDEVQWIVMENITGAAKSANYWSNFGKNLAEMHRSSNDRFGFESNNYLGNLPQSNDYKDDWPTFFAEQRIKPQLKMAKDKGLASSEMVKLFEKMLSRIERYFPVEPPAAVHGDLWTGNFSTDHTGEATIFDPSAHFGHREMDLAMSKLFGGFNPLFYEAYNEAYPLEKGWEERIPLGYLYPLLAHLNIFGETYASQIMGILRRKI